MYLRVNSTTTITEAVKLFLQSSKFENKTPNSIWAYKFDLNEFVEFTKMCQSRNWWKKLSLNTENYSYKLHYQKELSTEK